MVVKRRLGIMGRIITAQIGNLERERAAGGGGGGCGGSWLTTYGIQTPNTAFGVSSFGNVRNVFRNTLLSQSGNYIRLTFKFNTYTYTVSGVSIGPHSGSPTPNFSAAPTQVTFDGGNGSKAITGDTVSDEILFTLNAANSYMVAVYVTAATFNRWSANTLSPNPYFVFRRIAQIDETLQQFVGGYSSTTPFDYFLMGIEVCS
jgi:hypothetical protein